MSARLLISDRLSYPVLVKVLVNRVKQGLMTLQLEAFVFFSLGEVLLA
jgi:hypothetical protein